MATTDKPQLPIPISKIQDSYLLFDINAIAWLRANGQICGAFIGTLHQNPSQNVFLGLPLEIVPEEVNNLVEQGLCYVVNDAQAHEEMLYRTNKRGRDEYLAQLNSQANQISRLKAEEREAIQRIQMRPSMQKKKAAARHSTKTDAGVFEENDAIAPLESVVEGSGTSSAANLAVKAAPQQPEYTITPTTTSLLCKESQSETRATTAVLGLDSARNALTSYFHSSDSTAYFLHPGLRFGAHYSVYPGDPLRYHSHFLARAVDWEEEIDLIDLVGGGRLGTGVKKAYLLGGQQPAAANESGSEDSRMRLFSIEWAVM